MSLAADYLNAPPRPIRAFGRFDPVDNSIGKFAVEVDIATFREFLNPYRVDAPTSNLVDKDLGTAGEILVFIFMYYFKYKFKYVEWINESTERGAQYDLIMRFEGVKRFLEVKSTCSSIEGDGFDTKFDLSYLQWSKAKELGKDYYIIRVFNIPRNLNGRGIAKIQFRSMRDPYSYLLSKFSSQTLRKPMSSSINIQPMRHTLIHPQRRFSDVLKENRNLVQNRPTSSHYTTGRPTVQQSLSRFNDTLRGVGHARKVTKTQPSSSHGFSSKNEQTQQNKYAMLTANADLFNVREPLKKDRGFQLHYDEFRQNKPIHQNTNAPSSFIQTEDKTWIKTKNKTKPVKIEIPVQVKTNNPFAALTSSPKPMKTKNTLHPYKTPDEERRQIRIEQQNHYDVLLKENYIRPIIEKSRNSDAFTAFKNPLAPKLSVFDSLKSLVEKNTISERIDSVSTKTTYASSSTFSEKEHVSNNGNWNSIDNIVFKFDSLDLGTDKGQKSDKESKSSSSAPIRFSPRLKTKKLKKDWDMDALRGCANSGIIKNSKPGLKISKKMLNQRKKEESDSEDENTVESSGIFSYIPGKDEGTLFSKMASSPIIDSPPPKLVRELVLLSEDIFPNLPKINEEPLFSDLKNKDETVLPVKEQKSKRKKKQKQKKGKGKRRR